MKHGYTGRYWLCPQNLVLIMHCHTQKCPYKEYSLYCLQQQSHPISQLSVARQAALHQFSIRFWSYQPDQLQLFSRERQWRQHLPMTDACSTGLSRWVLLVLVTKGPAATLQVLSGLLAGVVSLTAFGAHADVELQDERDARQRGFDLIYEARDLDLGQNERDGLTQYRKNLESTKTRVKKSESIIDTKLEPLIQKKYW